MAEWIKGEPQPIRIDRGPRIGTRIKKNISDTESVTNLVHFKCLGCLLAFLACGQ